ncbi:MAG: glycosyltransferase family 1 protein [Armatimonadetes bacterium]|nr:glycosyltransferase family 1 protein [Armatimonadota bacterium]
MEPQPGGHAVIISSVEWEPLWQGQQEIASRLAGMGHRVLFVENTGIRAPGLPDARRVVHRVRHWWEGLRSGGVREVRPNLYVCAPLVMPPFGPPWRRELNRYLLLGTVRRVARRLGLRDPVVWNFLPTDTALDLINLLAGPTSPVVYYCIADFSTLAPNRSALARFEPAIARRADLVFAQCDELDARCRQWTDRVHQFPFGVSLEAFRHGEVRPLPAELRGLPHPIIGYVGGLHRFVHFEMLAEMAARKRDWSWVMVGPVQEDATAIRGLPNIHLLGPRQHGALSDYVQGFDVCVVPYRDVDAASAIVPTKIQEYLAMGKPVVAARLPCVERFNERHRVLITAPDQPDAFLAGIENALVAADDPLGRRREVAQHAGWDARLAEMLELVALTRK